VYNLDMSKQERIDIILTEQGLVESRSRAQRLIMAGQVRVDGQVIHKPSRRVAHDAQIEIESLPQFVSRGGEKLAAALEHFSIDVAEKVCADVGASTGGFTDCLLQNGAARVYAIDVGKGLLHWRLRKDSRIVIMDKTNARKLKSLPEPVGLVTIDASFISLRTLLPVVCDWLIPRGDVIALIKPQFEAGRKGVGKRGVVRDAAIHRQVVECVITSAIELGLAPLGVMQSPLRGPKGNVEFLFWCRNETRSVDFDIPADLFQYD
jgi:23S rRNA (cytidine1920-2'-O)/16S rRNA (cytidine1409-2'-O)-methyltransferase